MAESTLALGELAAASKQTVRRLLTIGGNRLELLRLEAQEERERFLQGVLLAVAAAVCSLLASLTLTAAIVVVFWPYSPVGVLLCLTVIYGAGAGFLCWRMNALFHDWQAFSASLDQFRKDCECLEKTLE